MINLKFSFVLVSFFINSLLSTFLQSIFVFFHSLVEEIGRFRSLVDTPDGLEEFRRAYGILDGAWVSHCLDEEVEFRRGLEMLIIPLVAFVGGVKIPMSKFFTNVAQTFLG